jgi:hypothetical protein
MHSDLRFTAYFKDPSPDAAPDDEVSRPVVGWREADGAAMILDAKSGRVVPAAEQEGFLEIEQVPTEKPLGVVPGNGWRISKTSQPQIRAVGREVPAFLVYATHVVPVRNLPMAGDSRGAWKKSEWRLWEPEE